MKHRHLNTTAWSLAAIDSCITRGFQADYEELGQAAIKDPEIMRDIRQLCEAVLARYNPENYDRELYEEWLSWATQRADFKDAAKPHPSSRMRDVMVFFGDTPK